MFHVDSAFALFGNDGGNRRALAALFEVRLMNSCFAPTPRRDPL
jgi:hypothetical protein